MPWDVRTVPERKPTTEEIRSAIAARLRDRRAEIEQAAATRVFAVSGPSEVEDPDYVRGLRDATAAAIAYGLDAIELGERSGPVPGVLLEQSRQAARYGISLDTVLRRYFAGYTLLGDFISEEAQRVGRLSPGALREVQRTQAALFDRLVAAVSEAHTREAGERSNSQKQRQLDLVRRLLDGELVNDAELDYDLECWHVGLVLDAPAATTGLVREVAREFDCRFMSVAPAGGLLWGWLARRRKLRPEEVAQALTGMLAGGAAVGVGEPGERLAGWRLTHRQARAALFVAQHVGGGVERYADVALLSSALADDLLATSLRQLYLEPLGADRDGGAMARATLRAYFAADRNAASAAVSLGMSRQAVTKRLRQIEERLDRPLGACGAELELSMRLDDLGRPG